ncbi:hypothetical protein V6N13_034125 [Hibiscus sabdariffa]
MVVSQPCSSCLGWGFVIVGCTVVDRFWAPSLDPLLCEFASPISGDPLLLSIALVSMFWWPAPPFSHALLPGLAWCVSSAVLALPLFDSWLEDVGLLAHSPVVHPSMPGLVRGLRCQGSSLGNLKRTRPPGCVFLRPVPPLLGPSVLGDSRSQGCAAKAHCAAKAPRAGSVCAVLGGSRNLGCAAKAHRAVYGPLCWLVRAPCPSWRPPAHLWPPFVVAWCSSFSSRANLWALHYLPCKLHLCSPSPTRTSRVSVVKDAEVPPLSPAPSVASSPPASASAAVASVPAPAASDVAASVPVSAPATSDAAASDVPVTAGCVAAGSAPHVRTSTPW